MGDRDPFNWKATKEAILVKGSTQFIPLKISNTFLGGVFHIQFWFSVHLMCSLYTNDTHYLTWKHQCKSRCCKMTSGISLCQLFLGAALTEFPVKGIHWQRHRKGPEAKASAKASLRETLVFPFFSSSAHLPQWAISSLLTVFINWQWLIVLSHKCSLENGIHIIFFQVNLDRVKK